jgi:hypothetical protein
MKKYIAAAAVAVMVFAFTAFAAQMTIFDSVLATGDGNVKACDAQVASWGLETDTGSVKSVRLTTDCTEDEVLFVRILDGAGNTIANSGEYRVGSDVFQQDGTQIVRFPAVQAADVEGIRIFAHTKK